jgi:uncharacterized repeat protein (TIGR01451 family)
MDSLTNRADACILGLSLITASTPEGTGDEISDHVDFDPWPKKAMCASINDSDLAVTSSILPDMVMVGDPLTYTATVTNGGPSAATGVILTDSLPSSVIYGSATPGQGTGCSESGGTVTCALGTLDSPGTVTITIVVTPTTEGVITNTASYANQFSHVGG